MTGKSSTKKETPKRADVGVTGEDALRMRNFLYRSACFSIPVDFHSPASFLLIAASSNRLLPKQTAILKCYDPIRSIAPILP